MACECSVVIPVRDGAAFIEPALHSVLDQRGLSFEILVVDDGSVDQTAAVVEQLLASSPVPSRLLRQDPRGAAAARNRGIAASQGRLIAFLDADDRWLPGKLERVGEAFRSRPGLDIVVHDERHVCAGAVTVVEYHRWYRPTRPLFPQLYLRNFFSTSATVVRRALLEEVGGFDETLRTTHDYDLWLRLALKDPVILMLPEVLGEFHIRGGSITTGDPQLRCAYQRMVARRHYAALRRYTRIPQRYYMIHVSRIHRGVAADLMRHREAAQAWRHLGLSILLNPFDWRGYAYPIHWWRHRRSRQGGPASDPGRS